MVFEGAQGVLLDELTRPAPVHDLDQDDTDSRPDPSVGPCDRPTAGVLGVLRTYQTRHGAGPLAGEDDDLLR